MAHPDERWAGAGQSFLVLETRLIHNDNTKNIYVYIYIYVYKNIHMTSIIVIFIIITVITGPGVALRRASRASRAILKMA